MDQLAMNDMKYTYDGSALWHLNNTNWSMNDMKYTYDESALWHLNNICGIEAFFTTFAHMGRHRHV